MTSTPNAALSAKQPVSRKRGGQPGNTNAFKLGSLYYPRSAAKWDKPPQRTKSPSSGSAAHIGVRPAWHTSAQSPRLVGVPHTSVCGQYLAVISEVGQIFSWRLDPFLH